VPAVPSFAQLLDEKLQETTGHDRVRTASQSARAFAPAHPLLFAAPYRFNRAFGNSGEHAPAAAETHIRRALPAVARRLTADELAALDALNRRGAGLSADFTASELRSAYRALALSYHPDRHTDNDRADRTRLAHLFGEIAKHHRTLLGAAR
jgi:hypothetical protein